MRTASDQELILLLKNGSLDALGVLYDRYRLMVYRTALAIANEPESAEDLLHDVFLRLYRFADRIDPSRPLEPWIYRMTANLAYTWVKQRQRRLIPLEDIVEWLAGSRRQSPHRVVELDEESYLVQQAILALPVGQRIVVVLYYLNDLSLEEIANILEIPQGTVKSRLYYGRQVLRKHLDIVQAETSSDLICEFT